MPKMRHSNADVHKLYVSKGSGEFVQQERSLETDILKESNKLRKTNSTGMLIKRHS